MHKNHEGYPDPTAGRAVHDADRPPEAVSWLIKTCHEIAGLLGYEIVGRLTVKDCKSKRIWK